MSASEPPAKRVRQACDPCRRKKSRCPGQKPVCSHCARLGQVCTYDGVRVSQATSTNENSVTTPSQPISCFTANTSPQTTTQADTSSRLSSLENQLAEVVATLRSSERSHRLSSGGTPVPRSYEQSQRPSPTSHQYPSHSRLPPWSTVENAGRLYLIHCHCQPLPLFSSTQLLGSLSTRDDELLLSLLALTVRFETDQSISNGHNETLMQYCSSARSLVMQRVVDGNVDLSTLQTLCLLSMVEFYHKNTHRSSIYSSLAAEISQAAGLATACMTQPVNSLQEEQLRCFWTITLLKRLHSNLLGPFSLSVDEKTVPVYPESSSRPILPNQGPRESSGNTKPASEERDLGIVAYAIQLTDVWARAAHYAHRRRSPGPHPPWSSESDYAKILGLQMERETSMPYSKHRFKPARFSERTAEDLAQHRDYWGPWLFNQMMYHTIICLLNHPLLLSLRLRSFKVASVPEIWLQHTDDLVTSHTQWIIHLIDLVNAKSFEITNPFLAYFAAIVATIFLQQSFVEDEEIKRMKKDSYSKCLRFCYDLSHKWPAIAVLTEKLQKFESLVMTSYQNSAVSQAYDKVYVDLTLFWEILEASLISEEADKDGIKLGSSLTVDHRPLVAAEEVSTRLLPEPTRLGTAVLGMGIEQQQPTTHLVSTQAQGSNSLATSSNDDFAVLAQSYFAQGQDFVGSLDDWWTLGSS